MFLELLLIRHGQTEWNKEGRIQGHIDIPLNQTGREEAHRLGIVLQRFNPTFFLSSDLSRAQKTCEIIRSHCSPNSTVFTCEELREIHLGKLQGLTREEIDQLYGPEFSSKLRNEPLMDQDITRFMTESGESVFQRAKKGITETLKRVEATRNSQRIVIVSHGGVIRRLIQYTSHSGGFPAPIKNCVIYPFESDGSQIRFKTFNSYQK
jgi:probable phosphoglycerate mutase